MTTTQPTPQHLAQPRRGADRRAFWGAALGALAGVVVGVFLGAGIIAQADNNRRTADVADGPLIVPYDGFLMLNSTPVDEEVDITFTLYGGPTCTDCQLWTETQTVQVHGGRFSVGLGSSTSIDAVILDAEKLYIGMAVDGAPLSGRQAIEPVPYAAWAGHGTEFRTNDIVPPSGMVADFVNVQSSLSIYGTDLVLGTNDGRPQGSRRANRAMVHGLSADDLVLNFGGDFEGGVQVQSNLDIDGNDLRLGASNLRFATFGLNTFTLNPGGNAPNGVNIESDLGLNGSINVTGTADINNVDTIRGDSNGLAFQGNSGAPTMTLRTNGQLDLPQNLTVAGTTSLSNDLTFINSGTSSDITSVNAIHGEGTLALYPSAAASNGATLNSSGRLTVDSAVTDSISTRSIDVTGTKSTSSAADSGYSISTFFNENWADCGNKPVTGVRLEQYTSGSDRRGRLTVRCGP